VRLPIILICIASLASPFLMVRTGEGADLPQSEKTMGLVEDGAEFWLGEDVRPSQGLNLSVPPPQWNDIQSKSIRDYQSTSRVLQIEACYSASKGRFLSELDNSIDNVSEFNAGMVRFEALKRSQLQFADCLRSLPS
jgi:hypothetical protein